ncbi:Ankyrin-3 [Fusarium avenaceum]|nr:Ankyrin-3 [Fusarium avenaceum]
MNSTSSTELAVPTYSAVDNDDLLTRIEAAPNVEFPILHSPAGRSTKLQRLTADTEWKTYHEAYRIETDIVDAFFSAIENGHDDIVADFISRGWVSPDTTNRWGETPLITAVRVGKLPMVSHLVALGATVNEYGRARDSDDIVRPEDFPERTPLMVAAERGHLALVKVLIQDYGAKHELIAPDGAMALRLAANNRHREIVQFLPNVRGGSWKRWKHVHHKQMERVRRAGRRLLKFLWIVFWDFPKLLVYDAPKELCRAAWNCRHRVKTFLKELPKEIKKQVIALPGHIKRAGKEVWVGIKKTPAFLKSVFQAIWRVMKRIPGGIMTILRWIGNGLKNIGQAIFNIITKAFSLLHTAVMAVVTFLRGITLRDIWDGFCYLVRAIFVDAPKAIGAFIMAFGKTTYDVLKALFGTLGACIWHIGAGILWVIQYVPRRIWTMIEALGTSLVKAFEEVMVFVNPKRM